MIPPAILQRINIGGCGSSVVVNMQAMPPIHRGRIRQRGESHARGCRRRQLFLRRRQRRRRPRRHSQRRSRSDPPPQTTQLSIFEGIAIGRIGRIRRATGKIRIARGGMVFLGGEGSVDALPVEGDGQASPERIAPGGTGSRAPDAGRGGVPAIVRITKGEATRRQLFRTKLKGRNVRPNILAARIVLEGQCQVHSRGDGGWRLLGTTFLVHLLLMLLLLLA
mmetsp:Transcript_11605/g.25436  ORF Transcript_11605/g.25436 Transcript_11605/m.25436 type:complete len:222 (+) Transcript_11605:3469-4134(+)